MLRGWANTESKASETKGVKIEWSFESQVKKIVKKQRVISFVKLFRSISKIRLITDGWIWQ